MFFFIGTRQLEKFCKVEKHDGLDGDNDVKKTLPAHI